MKILMCEHLPWRSLVNVGSHHLAREFLRRGHDVFWLAAPIHLPKNPVRLASDPEVRRDLSQWLAGVRREGRLVEVLPFTLFPWVDLPLLRHPVVAAWSVRCTLPRVSSVLRREGFDDVDLLWLTYPLLGHVRRMVRHRCLAHRITDDYASFAGLPPSFAAEHRALLRDAHVVVAAAAGLAESARAHNANAHYLSNGVDVDAFAAGEPPRPAAYEGLSGRIFVYTGGIYEGWFDGDLVAELARRFPGDHVVLVGPYDRPTERLRSSPNVRLVGPRPYREMPAFLRWADVGLIPWKDTPTARSANPLKLFEYCACGLPVVASQLPAIEQLASPAWLATGPDAWEAALRLALEPGPRGKGGDGLQAFARAHTWRAWMDRLFELHPAGSC